MASDRSIAVFGAGAVGCYLGGTLARAGYRVTLLGRTGLVEAVKARGLILRENGSETVVHPNAATSVTEVPRCDLVLLTVRAYDVGAAIPDVAAVMGRAASAPGGIVAQQTDDLSAQLPHVLAMQNGVGSEEQIAEALGRERVLAGTLTISVGLSGSAGEPAMVTRYSARGGVALSTMNGAPVPGWIVEAFASAGLPVGEVVDYRSLRWSKLLLNMLGAATSAILDMDMAELAANPDLFRLEQLAIREAGRVMDARKIRTVSLPGYPVPLLRLAMRWPRLLAQRAVARRLAGARRGRSPTARADIERGRSEIPFLNGAVAAAGRLGLRAPVNAALTELVEELLIHPELRAQFRGRPERLLEYMRGRGVRV